MDRRVSRILEQTLRKPDTPITDIFCSDLQLQETVSQSIQLLQHALAPAPQSQERGRIWGPASPNDGNTVIDFSLDSRIIPARPATPRYHCLRVSCSQSPESSSSQKEKHHQEDGAQDGACHIASPVPSKIYVEPIELGSGSEFFHPDGYSPVTSAAGKVIGTRTASFHFPHTTAPFSRPTSMPVGNKEYPRSPSLSSQDSFGGSVSQDPAEQYLASAKPFNVPLSDLGETPTQEVIHSPTDPGMTLPDASEHKELLEAAMRKYEAQRASRATSNRRANVLVAATPSNSDESLGLPQYKFDDFPFSNHGPHFTGQEARFEFNVSSSFDKMLNRGLADVPDPTPEPTQPEETGPVQVNSIVDTRPSTSDTIPTTPPQNSKQASPPFEWIAPAPSTAVSSSNPRSLLRMIHPRNEYRIAKMRDLAGAVEPPSCVTMGTETQPSRMEETQPCHVDYSNVHPPPRPASRQTRVTGSRPIIRRRKGDDDDEAEDALDVVPDSEPLRAGHSTQTPAHHRTVRPVSAGGPFHPCSPISEQGSAELVPDSLEVEVEGSEVEVPLANEVISRNTKGSAAPVADVGVYGRKTRTYAIPAKAPSSALEEQPRRPTSSSRKGKNSKAKPSKTEPTEIPTSLPEQDLPSHAPTPAAVPISVQSFKKKRSESSRSRHTSAIKPVVGKKRFHKSDTETSADSSQNTTEDEGAMHPEVRKKEEEVTESADDVDSPPPPPAKSDTSRKKRRRIEDPNLTSKVSTSTRNKRSETPGVATRSVKKLRSGIASTRGLATEPATRVFALWKQDGHYYSGVVHSCGPKNKYLVKFDDGTEDNVELKNMRHRVLQIGDRVITAQDGTKATVSDVTDAGSQGWFTLEIDDGEGVSSRPADFADIRIANRTIQSQWKERTLAQENIVPLIGPKPLLDTTPSKQSAVSTTSGKAQRELVRTGFIVTINPKNEEPDRTKTEALRAIKRHGGEMIEDWASVFIMEGKHSSANKRWIATPQDFRWNSKRNLDRVFLLSDEAHQKPKFLLALALGIPCLSFEWLTREGKFSSDWQPFLLPAGYSDALGARISQLVDLDWGNCTEHLTDIMTSRVPIKLFLQKTVLCVGTDLVPLPSNRARKNAPEEASRYVPWIILCMGAAKVEAVTDTNQVSPNEMRTFDYVIVKERSILGSVSLGEKAVVGDVDWIKECLVSSRLSRPELD